MLVHRAARPLDPAVRLLRGRPRARPAAAPPAPIEEIEVDFAGGSTQALPDRPRLVRGARRGRRARGRAPRVRLAALGGAARAGGRARPRRRRPDAPSRPGCTGSSTRSCAAPARAGASTAAPARARARASGSCCPTSPRRSSCSAGRARRAIYGGELGRAIAATSPASPRRRPRRLPRDPPPARLASRYRGHELVSNPPPSSGGILIAYGLALLERLGREDAAALVETMREQSRRRAGPEFVRAPAPRRARASGCSPARPSTRGLERVRAGLAGAAEPPRARRDDAHLGRRREPATRRRSRARPAPAPA